MFVVSDVAAVLDGCVIYRPNADGVFDVPDQVGLVLCATHGARRATWGETTAAGLDKPTVTYRMSE